MALDPISTGIALEISKIVIKSVWEGGGKAAAWMGGGLNDAKKTLIFRAGEKYVENYSNRHTD
ncbi:MAG: hypothetical protein LH660_09020 [Phormidesmis sp. CAN_BIN36]|nr:hypothetical protein [Phormidesmis sp. CAN_BIN36]